MDDTPTSTPGPRRSQRDRKTVKPFASDSTKRKRRLAETDAEDDAPVTNVEGEGDQEIESEEDEQEHNEARHVPKQKRKRAKASGNKSKGAPPTKRPRTTETDAEGPTSGGEEADASAEEDDDGSKTLKGGKKAKGSPKVKTKRPRKPKGTATTKQPKPGGRRGRRVKDKGEGYDAEQIAKDTKIANDNTLFNALVDPTVALQDAAQDFVRSLQETPEAAQAELVNLILRCCGCNDSVDSNQAVDYDGVVDALDNFTEALKQENSPVYPLTSKLPIFKQFRASLSEFIDRLVSSAADLGVLYTSDFMSTLQTWVIAMSSSQIRSFRHTATVVALEVETSLCDAAAAVDKEAEVVSRQREGEKKRKGTGKGSTARDKGLEAKAREIRERRTKLAEYLKEIVDGVFVHRYRDLDPNIRAECVRSIGQWFSKYPGHFLDNSYLRYVGWVLSDANTHVRLEAVKSLSSVYDQDEYIGTLTHFTERFKPRLLEMATSDIELSVRVAVIQVLEAIDAQSLLEEEEREKLCLLVFDEEVKVRKAVGGFVKRVWKETLEERIVLGRKGKGRKKGKELQEKDEERVGLKALVASFEKWAKVLSELDGDAEDSENGDDVLVGDANGQEENESVDGPSRRASRRKEVLALVGTDKKGRVTLAVEALWNDVDPLNDWQGILDMLLLDHSSGSTETQTQNGRVNGKEHTPPEPETVIQDSWRLEEGEETILLEILVTSIRQTKLDAVGGKKGEEENVTNDITRELIKALPRLFIKYQTDQNRIANVLLIPSLMNLDLYLEMRMISAYNALWDDIIKQFMSHSSVTVLSHAITTIRYLMDATSLSNANSTKILELEDELATALRDTVGGRDEIEVATLAEDEVLALGAHCSRLAVLFGVRNLTAWMEEDESGKQSSAWDIVSALVERGRLGYKEEEGMVEHALHVLTLHIIWKRKDLSRLQAGQELATDEGKYREFVKQQRDSLVEKLFEFAIGTQSNTAEGVKRAAFKYLLDLHVLFAPVRRDTTGSDGGDEEDPLALALDDETQYRCAGYIQAEIERFAESLEDDAARAGTPSKRGSDDEQASGEDEDDNNDRSKSKEKEKTTQRKKGQKREVDTDSRPWLEREYLFVDVISTFLRAIRAGAITIHHGSVLLAHYGRLGVAFDTCVKVVVDVLREEGLAGDNGEIIVAVVTKAIQEAFSLVLDGYVEDEYGAVQLAKLLSSCYVIRGGQLVILRRLDTEFIVQIQTNLLNWVAKRLAAYQSNKNKKALRKCLLFFRVMVPLLSSIRNRDALKIKAHMDQIFDQAKVEVPPTLKVWEPQRLYEKKLNNVMNKEKATEGRRRRADKGTASAGELTSADEESEAERMDIDGEQVKTSRTKPKLLRATRRTRANPNVEEDVQEEQEQPNGANELGQDQVMVTPKAGRTQPSVAAPSPAPSKDAPLPAIGGETKPEPATQPTQPPPPTPPMAAGEGEEVGIEVSTDTPKAKKRTRADSDEDLEASSQVESQEAEPPGHEVPSTPVDEVHVRRKRIRR